PIVAIPLGIGLIGSLATVLVSFNVMSGRTAVWAFGILVWLVVSLLFRGMIRRLRSTELTTPDYFRQSSRVARVTALTFLTTGLIGIVLGSVSQSERVPFMVAGTVTCCAAGYGLLLAHKFASRAERAESTTLLGR
ncbi:MAG TPA: hypothetical protein VL382_05230, partial [Terriglobales bacterium]|nr:hypothetical protein [Terriglobales bacterium]